jgi:hypothetical protein
MTHSEAYMMVRGKRGVMRRKVGNNTYAEILQDGSIGIMLHSTYVVKIHTGDTYTMQTGGWYTVTTKDRINQYVPGRVYQADGQWYYKHPNGKKYEFIDGMVVGN